MPKSAVGAVDPGKTGGLAFLDETGKILALEVMPVITSSKAKKEYDLQAIKALFIKWDPAVLVFEKLQPMPVALGGSIANYARGYGRGSLEGLAVGMGRKYVLVAPQTWQAEVLRDINCDDTKQAALIVAKRLWPDQTFLASERSRKPHEGLVDSCLIAEFGRRRRF